MGVDLECSVAELKVASGEAPRVPGRGYVALPEDMPERAKKWAEDEAERQKKREALTSQLQVSEKDPSAALERSFVIPSWASRIEPNEEEHGCAHYHMEQCRKPRTAGQAHGVDALFECFALEVGRGRLCFHLLGGRSQQRIHPKQATPIDEREQTEGNGRHDLLTPRKSDGGKDQRPGDGQKHRKVEGPQGVDAVCQLYGYVDGIS